MQPEVFSGGGGGRSVEPSSGLHSQLRLELSGKELSR